MPHHAYKNASISRLGQSIVSSNPACWQGIWIYYLLWRHFKLVGVSTHLNNISQNMSKWESSPNRGENKNIFDTTTQQKRYGITWNYLQVMIQIEMLFRVACGHPIWVHSISTPACCRAPWGCMCAFNAALSRVMMHVHQGETNQHNLYTC